MASVAACAATQLGATEADLARGRSTAAQGGTLFTQACSHCHGERGEGLAGASAILGPGALPEYPRDNSGPGSAVPTDPQQLQIQTQTRPAGAPWRDPFRTAQNLYDFVSTHMPKNQPNELKSDDYWAIVTFMETVQGAQVPPGGINASNASAIPIARP
ncbi:MAG TPA: c-type cytochrome [Polyangiaceae bacterium]